ncbi:MAG: imidazole glycerol phosphate synthase subunit HisH [Gammaproteobacteria bacterium]
MSAVAIIDSGGANIASLRFALQRLGAEPVLTRDAEVLLGARHVLLPGVGAAADAMKRLRESGLDAVIRDLTQPVLGICLGMQLLFERSVEGEVECLGIIDGCVEPLPAGPDLCVPHMGWNQTRRPGVGVGLSNSDSHSNSNIGLLEGIAEDAYFYFVHSYAAAIGPATAAVTTHGVEFSAVVSRLNFHGTQFHPERSGAAGARVLKNFLELT